VELVLTQQYLVGELSLLLGALEPAPSVLLGNAVHDLRRSVELGPLPILPELAREAMELSDSICWTALEQGDVGGFSRYAGAAVALWEFTINANLMTEWLD
jgi:hypothetical protein